MKTFINTLTPLLLFALLGCHPTEEYPMACEEGPDAECSEDYYEVETDQLGLGASAGAIGGAIIVGGLLIEAIQNELNTDDKDSDDDSNVDESNLGEEQVTSVGDSVIRHRLLLNEETTQTSDALLQAQIVASDSANVLTHIFLSESATDPDLNDIGWIEIDAKSSVDLQTLFALAPNSETERIVYLWVRNSQNAISSAATAAITWTPTDTTAPNITSMQINSGATQTQNFLVSVTLNVTDDTGVVGYWISHENQTPTSQDVAWNLVSPGTSFEISTSVPLEPHGVVRSETRTLYAWVKDVAGNISSVSEDSISLEIDELVDPVINTFEIENGFSNVNNTLVSIELASTDTGSNVVGYFLSETNTDPTFDSNWVPVTAVTNYSDTLSFSTAYSETTGASDRTIYVWTADGGGNISLSNSASIQVSRLENNEPTSVTLSINEGDANTSSSNVTLSIRAVDDENMAGYLIQEVPITPTANDVRWVPASQEESVYEEEVSYTLKAIEGDITLYAWVKDTSGNVSAMASDSITQTLDGTAPVTPQVNFLDESQQGILNTTSTSVLVQVITSDADSEVTALLLSETNSTPALDDSSWQNVTANASINTTLSFELSADIGVKSVFVWARDTAGNISEAGNAVIQLTN